MRRTLAAHSVPQPFLLLARRTRIRLAACQRCLPHVSRLTAPPLTRIRLRCFLGLSCTCECLWKITRLGLQCFSAKTHWFLVGLKKHHHQHQCHHQLNSECGSHNLPLKPLPLLLPLLLLLCSSRVLVPFGTAGCSILTAMWNLGPLLDDFLADFRTFS